jgi:hypothetical protein
MIYHGFTVLPGADVTIVLVGQLQATSSVWILLRIIISSFTTVISIYIIFDPPLIRYKPSLALPF